MAAMAASVLDPRMRPPAGSIGAQVHSKRETMPAYSIGNATRENSTKKVFISNAHQKLKGCSVSPGPVYDPPTLLGTAPKFTFGCDEQRKEVKSQYPESSVDLTGSLVDSQSVKFSHTKGVHFGTESRSNYSNADVIRTHPGVMMGLEAPGALEYRPEKSEALVIKSTPRFSFGPVVNRDKKDKGTDKGPVKPVTRLHVPSTGTPRHVGPGSFSQAPGLGQQPSSARTSAPSFSFGGAIRMGDIKRTGQILDTSTDLSSLGKQVVSQHKSSPTCCFGDTTREKAARSQVVMTQADRGPAAALPKPNHHYDLPLVPTAKMPAKPGF